MTEATEQQTEPAADSQPTLDDVYKEYGVEGAAKQFQAATAQPAPSAEDPDVPDPVVDPDGYKRFQSRQMSEQKKLQESLNQYGSVVTNMVHQEQRRQLEADVNTAVDYVKSKIEGDVDRDMLEVALDLEARRDPRFLQVFADRGKNPQAWNKALDAFSRKASGKFAVRSDPQLAENQRAVKASQQAQATTKAQSANDEWSELSPADFDAKWRQMVNS
jgi:hypothetical protein